jgi:hypothetical protein
MIRYLHPAMTVSTHRSYSRPNKSQDGGEYVTMLGRDLTRMGEGLILVGPILFYLDVQHEK